VLASRLLNHIRSRFESFEPHAHQASQPSAPVRPGADFVSLGKVSKGGLDKKNTFFGHVGFFRTRGFQPLTLEQLYNNVLGHA
jgi:hypothetical protein